MKLWKLLGIMGLGAMLVLCGVAATQRTTVEAGVLLLCGVGCAICALLAVIIDRMPPPKD